jgi:anti-sigma factor RsiW
MLPWKKRAVETDLSAYRDGQLPPDRTDRIGEELVFNPDYRDRLAAYDQIADLLKTELGPDRIPDSIAFSRDLVDRLQLDTPQAEPAPNPNRLRSAMRPALWASLGLVATAGITLFSLRRRKLT